MITDDEVESAVEFLRTGGRKAAKARAERIYMEEYRKVVKAKIMRERESLAIGAQERDAYSDPRYVEHLNAMRTAIENDEFHLWALVAAQAKIEAWRTQQSNARSLGKLE